MPLAVCLCLLLCAWLMFSGIFLQLLPKVISCIRVLHPAMDSAILPPGNFCWVVLRDRESILVKVLRENTALSESNHWTVCNDSELWKDIWGQRHFIHSFWWKQNYRKLFPLFLSLWGHSKASRASAECTTALLEALFIRGEVHLRWTVKTVEPTFWSVRLEEYSDAIGIFCASD